MNYAQLELRRRYSQIPRDLRSEYVNRLTKQEGLEI